MHVTTRRDQNGALANQRPKVTANTRSLERQGTDCPSEPPEGTDFTGTLILDLWPPEL
jgi:hypothetical protein